jgi:hypothetical protein
MKLSPQEKMLREKRLTGPFAALWKWEAKFYIGIGSYDMQCRV